MNKKKFDSTSRYCVNLDQDTRIKLIMLQEKHGWKDTLAGTMREAVKLAYEATFGPPVYNERWANNE